MSMRKPPKKKAPDQSALDDFAGGAADRQGSSKKKTSKKKAAKKVVSGDVEKDDYKYTFLIAPSYFEKIEILREQGINIQTKLRKTVYPMIDKLIDNLEDEE